ncbi:MAG: DUF2306 domain-containing protein [Proteobacteria bacterium]|nr:DUF2306 domain-containing protein [Pseudomonadota bacterium]
MAFLAVAIGLHALRFYFVPAGTFLQVDDGIRGVIERVPVQALAHMLIAPIALIVGPFQFFSSIRTKRPTLHRTLGKIYVAACTIAGLGALAAAPFASGGPIAGLGFATLAVLWIATTLGAWRAAVQRKFDLHRLLMRFSYAMTFGAVTLRLQIPFFMMMGYHTYPQASVWLAYTSWIPNVIVVALYAMWEALRRPTLVAAE